MDYSVCKTVTEESETSVAVAEQLGWGGGGASISHVYCTAIYYIHTSDEPPPFMSCCLFPVLLKIQ